LSALKVQVEEKVKEANSDKFKKIMKDLQEYTDLQSGLQVNKGVVDKFREKQIFWIKVLDALPDVVPAQVWLTSFTHALEKGKVVLTMRASATSPDEAAHFYSNLENYDFFKNVNLQAITSAVYNNAIVVNFIITTELEGV
jgi:Tfp pilus assembly protein PilN